MRSKMTRLRERIIDVALLMEVKRVVLPSYHEWLELVDRAVSYDPCEDGPEVEILRGKNA